MLRDRLARATLAVAAVGLAVPSAALAHEAPDEGAEWLMADWMLLSFLVMSGAALLVFLFALKRGLLSNLEEAKFIVLEVDEDDYYTPDWAREPEDEARRRWEP